MARSTRRHRSPRTGRSWFRVGSWSLLFAALLLGTIAQSQEQEPAAQPAAPAVNAAGQPDAAADEKSYNRGVVIDFDGEITQWLEGYFLRKLAKAEAAGCDLIIVRMESPGGLLLESQNLAAQLRDATGIHTVAYVPEYAYSGGAYVSLGCDEIVMGPSASLGDVGVIFQEYDAFRYVPEKLASPVITDIRKLAEVHGRPPALAEAMVNKDLEVYRVRNKVNQHVTFMSERELEAQPDQADWERLELVLESEKGKFLTVTGDRAVALHLASATANTLDEVKQRYKVRDNEWLHYKPDNIDRAVYVLTMWWVTALLFIAGMIGLVHELAAPGTCLGGLAALTCFSLFFWSRFLVGTSGLLELVLFMLALVFLGVEIFVLPGFGVSGIAGLLLLGLSLVLACQTFIIPETQAEWSRLGMSISLVGGVGIFLCIGGVVALQYFGNLPFFNRLVLAPPLEEPARHEEDEVAGKKPWMAPVRVGEIGRAEYPLRPSGRGRFGDQFLEVVADEQFISRGAAIEVVSVDEHTILVREVKNS